MFEGDYIWKQPPMAPLIGYIGLQWSLYWEIAFQNSISMFEGAYIWKQPSMVPTLGYIGLQWSLYWEIAFKT